MEVCYYCKVVLLESDATVKAAAGGEGPKNLYHTACWKQRKEIHKYAKIVEPEKKRKNWLMIGYISSISVFFVELIAIVLIILL